MYRRTLLTALGSGGLLAGCLERIPRSPSTDRVLRRISVDSTEEVPVEGLSLEVGTTRSRVTREKTARIEITITNESNDAYWIEESYGVFNQVANEERDPGILLLPSDLNVDKVSDDCWRPEVSRIEELFPDVVVVRTRLDAGESKTAVRKVWDHFENVDECLVPGTYQFRSPYTVAEESDAEGMEFSWGFTLAIESS
jgi:hypothetical protein